jgi:hypothetical protein
MVLVPGHLIVAQSSSFWNRTVLKLWSMQSFVGAPGPIMAEEIPHLSIDHIGSPTPHVGGSLRVSAHLSPLHHDVYTVWVVVVENGEMMTVRQYRLLLHLQPPQLLVHSTVRGPTGGYTSWTRSGPSYAGFMSVPDVTWRRRFILSLKNTPSRIMMDHDIDVHCLVHVSAYSGAITHAKDDQIVVDYYL